MAGLIVTSVCMVWACGDEFPGITAKRFLHQRTFVERVETVRIVAGAATGFLEPHLAEATGAQHPLPGSGSRAVGVSRAMHSPPVQ